MDMETITLVKGDDRFILHYEVGREAEALDSLTDQVQAGRAGFDWFDAAIMSNQLGKNLAKNLKCKAIQGR